MTSETSPTRAALLALEREMRETAVGRLVNEKVLLAFADAVAALAALEDAGTVPLSDEQIADIVSDYSDPIPNGRRDNRVARLACELQQRRAQEPGATTPPIGPQPTRELLTSRAAWYADGCDGLDDSEEYRRQHPGGLAEDAASDLRAALALSAGATPTVAQVKALRLLEPADSEGYAWNRAIDAVLRLCRADAPAQETP